jgi:hypothetical protein
VTRADDVFRFGFRGLDHIEKSHIKEKKKERKEMKKLSKWEKE